MKISGAGTPVADYCNAESIITLRSGRPGSTDYQRQHTPQMTDHWETPVRGVSVMNVTFTSQCGAFGVGHMLTERRIGSGSEEHVRRKIPMKKRDNVLARTKRHGHPRTRRFTTGSDDHGSLHLSFFKQFGIYPIQTSCPVHITVGNRIEIDFCQSGWIPRKIDRHFPPGVV